MAVKLITGIQNWVGLSTDTKPTTTTTIGSGFWETDLGHNWLYNGSSWVRAFPSIDVNAHGGLIMVSHFEHETHAGDMWSAANMETLASGSVSSILLETPGSAVASYHLIISLHSSAAGTLVFAEGEGGTVGTAITPQNNNRIIAGSSSLISLSNTTAGTVETVLAYVAIGAGSPAGKIGGDLNGANPWILEHEMRYSLQFTCSAATNVAWNLYFVEEEA